VNNTNSTQRPPEQAYKPLTTGGFPLRTLERDACPDPNTSQIQEVLETCGTDPDIPIQALWVVLSTALQVFTIGHDSNIHSNP